MQEIKLPALDNHGMGTIFEELIRKFNEENNEEAGAMSEWYGVLPERWECKKIGSLFSERRTKVSDKDYPPLSVAKIGVVPQLASAVKTDAGDNRKLVKAGDWGIQRIKKYPY